MGISKEYAATLRAMTPAEAAKVIAKTFYYLTLEETCENVCEADFDTDDESADTKWVDETLAAMEDHEFAPEDEDEEEDEDEDDTYCFE